MLATAGVDSQPNLLGQVLVAFLGAALAGVFAFVVWAAQRYQTRRRIRHQLFRDIQNWRESLMLMGRFFDHLRNAIEKREPRSFRFERSAFPVYDHLISELHLLNDHEMDVVTSFYDWYRTYESDIVSICQKLQHWENTRRGQSEDDREHHTALYGLTRILSIRDLLLKNTQGKGLKEFTNDYGTPLSARLAAYRKNVLKETGYELL